MAEIQGCWVSFTGLHTLTRFDFDWFSWVVKHNTFGLVTSLKYCFKLSISDDLGARFNVLQLSPLPVQYTVGQYTADFLWSYLHSVCLDGHKVPRSLLMIHNYVIKIAGLCQVAARTETFLKPLTFFPWSDSDKYWAILLSGVSPDLTSFCSGQTSSLWTRFWKTDNIIKLESVVVDRKYRGISTVLSQCFASVIQSRLLNIQFTLVF